MVLAVVVVDISRVLLPQAVANTVDNMVTRHHHHRHCHHYYPTLFHNYQNTDRLRRLCTEADYYGLHQLVHNIDVLTIGQKVVLEDSQ